MLVVVDGKTLRFSNLDKVLYPQTGFRKADVIEFYRQIAPAILPHLSGRPLTVKRYPDGVGGFFFYEKNCPTRRPPWVQTVPVWSEGNQRQMQYCVVEDLPSLLWTANLASLELHISLSKRSKLDCPTAMVFDLDPGPPADIVDCADVALWLRKLLEQFSLETFVKTSGKKGLQVYVPIHRTTTYDQTKALAHAVARLLEEQHPKKVVSLMRKELRHGKVFVDWSQNDEHKTTVSVYSLRAESEPTVSTPVTWNEIEAAAKKRRPDLLRFCAKAVLRRVDKYGDLFAPVERLRQKLPTFSVIGSAIGEGRAHGRRNAARVQPVPPLSEYVKKRNFGVTPEPGPHAKKRPAPAKGGHPSYMIHKHHASRLHYDLRLEMDEALASWAIPKGPSYDTTQKRLAVQTEDHPLAYGEFEGRIPEGEYGAGDSIIWDRGVYDTLPPGNASLQRQEGHLDLVFYGEKLKGRFQLIRTRTQNGKANWLFFKSKDEYAASSKDIVSTRPESVASGRRTTRGPETKKARSGEHPQATALLTRMFPPMQATLKEALPGHPEAWWLEVKYDGYRGLAALSGRDLAMWTRNRLDLTARFPHIARALHRISVAEMVIDGEIVALDAKGRSRFERLGEGDEYFFAFDLLWLDGKDLRQEPIETRRELLESVLANVSKTVSPSERLAGDPEKLLRKLQRRGQEGMVAKRKGSVYENRRSPSWIKLKVAHSQELAIIGYTPHRASSRQMGALLLAFRTKGGFRFAGKVGTGFSQNMRRQLYAQLNRTRADEPVAKDAPRLRDAVWVKPMLVAQVHFTEWTADSKLRHPRFVGLREDKAPEECVREFEAVIPRAR